MKEETDQCITGNHRGLISRFSNRNKRTWRPLVLATVDLIICCILALLAGYNVLFKTSDSIAYENYFDSISAINPLGVNGFEPLFNLLACIAKLGLGLDYHMFVSVLMLMALLLKFGMFQDTRYPFLLTIGYIFTLYFVFECLTIRAALATSLAYLAFSKPGRVSLLIRFVFFMSACLIHLSYLFFLPILILNNHLCKWKSFSRNVFLTIVASGIIAICLVALASNNSRIYDYVFKNPAYFNIWGTPKIVLLWVGLVWLGKIQIKERESKTPLFFLAASSLTMSTILFTYSMFSIRILDMGLLAFYLLFASTKSKSKWAGLMFLVFLLIEEIFMRTLNLPSFIVGII